mgnify:CR=1 FL=1
MSTHIDRLSSSLLESWRDEEEDEERRAEENSKRSCELLSVGKDLLPDSELDTFELAPSALYSLCVKASETSLAMLLCWLDYDERHYSHPKKIPNPAPFFSRAGGKIVEAGADDKLMLLYAEGIRFPLAFAVIKDDTFTIDIIGVFTKCKRRGVGKYFVSELIKRAKMKGCKEYRIKSLISSILFWRGCGFSPIPARDLGFEDKKELEYHRPMTMQLTQHRHNTKCENW